VLRTIQGVHPTLYTISLVYLAVVISPNWYFIIEKKEGKRHVIILLDVKSVVVFGRNGV